MNKSGQVSQGQERIEISGEYFGEFEMMRPC